MAEDPIRRYSQATQELDTVIAKVQNTQSLISEVATILLRTPFNLMVSNVSVGFPAEVSLNPNTPSLNGNNWPTAKQIAELLAELHDNRDKVNHAWSALSDADKKLVTQHPSIK